MNERDSVMEDSMPDARTSFAVEWRIALGLALAALAELLALYHGTLGSMLDIWERSETYAHGYLIFPISVWLIWRQRDKVAQIPPSPDYRAAPMLLLAGLGWLVARLTDVLVIEQLALIGMIPCLAWMLLGWPVVRALLFPLCFLFFAVPMGEFLIPPLMNFTADFTVILLRLTGIPVYREGTFFSIPSGDWSVVEACSGLRYLIASITLGFLYAHLTYISPWRKLAFMAVSVIVPIIANGLRAYMIVMIGHLSGMTLAVGVDHLIYGWVFFGLVMLLMFWLGSLWADAGPGESARPALPSAASGLEAGGWPLGKCFILAVAMIVIWPARVAYIEWRETQAGSVPVVLALPEAAGAWQATSAMTDWAPEYSGQDAEARQAYGDGTATVEVFVKYYRRQTQDAELINSQNVLVSQGHPAWRMLEERPVPARLNAKAATVLQGQLQSTAQRLLVWRWNRIGGSYTANDYVGKLLEAKGKLLGAPSDGVALIIATEHTDHPDAAAQVLQRFVDAMLPALEHSLDQAAANR